jgi:hypothetical protein
MLHEQNTVRILGPSNHQVGTGILVGPAHILTCTHVVAAAQGRPDADTAAPHQGVRVELPFLAPPAGGPLRALPHLCKPVLPEPQVGDLADIALLRLEDASRLPVDAAPAALCVLHQPYGRAAAAFGFQHWNGATVKLSLLAINASGAVQIEQRPGYPEVGPGFSGAAVREVRGWTVIGMLVRRDRGERPRSAYMIPSAQLAEVLDEAGLIAENAHPVADVGFGPEQARGQAPHRPTRTQLDQLRELLVVVFQQHQTARARRAWLAHALCAKPMERLDGWEDAARIFAGAVLAWIEGFHDQLCDDARPVLCQLLGALGEEGIGADGRGRVADLAAQMGCRGPALPSVQPAPLADQRSAATAEPAGRHSEGRFRTPGSHTPCVGEAQTDETFAPETLETDRPIRVWGRTQSGSLRKWLLPAAGIALLAAVTLAALLWPRPPLALALNEIAPSGADVTVNFLQRDPDGQFNRLLGAGVSQSVLYTEDRYRIHIAARRDAYLYIVHFDSNGDWRLPLADDRGEDIADPQERHRLRAGQSIVLPGTFHGGRRDSYELYPLKHPSGTESFHFVLSTRPVKGLIAAYRSALGKDLEPSAPGNKPIESKRSALMREELQQIPPATRMARPAPDLDTGDGPALAPLLECQAPGAGCSAALVIRHLQRAQP